MCDHYTPIIPLASACIKYTHLKFHVISYQKIRKMHAQSYCSLLPRFFFPSASFPSIFFLPFCHHSWCTSTKPAALDRKFSCFEFAMRGGGSGGIGTQENRHCHHSLLQNSSQSCRHTRKGCTESQNKEKVCIIPYEISFDAVAYV